MQTSQKLINNQYHFNGLYDEIIKRLIDQGIDINKVSRKDIAGVDEFHVRGAAVSKELVTDYNFSNLKVLDVGCGLGGPCRMLADEFNCEVSGIDMCSDFIETAKKLSDLVSINGSTNFVQGDALSLPYPNESFDIVWTQHVQMNIEDKTLFYSEINRVLKKGGAFIYYDIFCKENKDVTYPVPWANTIEVSFLGTIEAMDTILLKLGFNKSQTKDQTELAKEFLNNLFEKIKRNGPPKLGLNVLMGSSTKEKLGNILKGLEENKIELQSGIYLK